ncbi:MAG TPA: M48 family metallopeptidase [Paracoccaceae bacterium]|nr:M48 family metallopeptidase [Paracoccaceae bacterium]
MVRIPFLTTRAGPALHLAGLPGVEVALRRSARARRMTLRVGRADGQVVLTLPRAVRAAEAEAFLAAQEGWLRRTLAGLPVRRLVGAGTLLPVEGRHLELVAPGGRGGVRVEGATLVVPGAPEASGARAAAFLRALARDRLALACDRHSGALGRPYTALALRDTRSRWGSCSAQGRLMFSWRLAMAPPAVLDYVAAHEVAHLDRMDHSPAFWRVVDRLCPGWQAQRAWLRSEGAALQALRFTTGD